MPYDALYVTCQFLLAFSDRETLLRFALAAASCFAPAICLALAARNNDCSIWFHAGPIPAEHVDQGPETNPAVWRHQVGQYVFRTPSSKEPLNAKGAYVYRLMLPKRDKHRRLLSQHPPAALSIPYSPIHSSVRIPDDQLRQMTVPVMPAPPACWHLSVPERWTRWTDLAGRVLPDTLQSLQIADCQFDSLQTTINIAAVLPLKLTSLKISVSKTVTDDGALCYLFAHLPPTLSDFQFSVVSANADAMNHGVESTRALVTALVSLPALTVFKHDWLRIKDVGFVLDALTSRPGYPTMRSLSLVLLVRNTEPADLATLEPGTGATLRVEHLDPKWPPQLLSLRLAKNKFHTLVTPLPATLRVLDLRGNPKLSDEPFPEEWIDDLPASLREIDVTDCMLDDAAGRRLMALRRRAGVSRAGHARLRVVDEGKSWFSPNIAALLRSDVL
ncbi:hypothetical protein GGF32_006247 [Allomyces javanicus]|nr:hypothetical protein GGF32_006247 [Allomyces javanicus]